MTFAYRRAWNSLSSDPGTSGRSRNFLIAVLHFSDLLLFGGVSDLEMLLANSKISGHKC
jgi:hypothetical protein